MILWPNLHCSNSSEHKHVAKSSRCIGEPCVLIPCFANYMDKHMDVWSFNFCKPFVGILDILVWTTNFFHNGLLITTSDTNKVLCKTWSGCVELWCNPIYNVVWDLTIWWWDHIELVPKDHGTSIKFACFINIWDAQWNHHPFPFF